MDKVPRNPTIASPDSSAIMGHPEWRPILGIVMVALVLRLGVVWVTARSHDAGWFFGQASELGKLAESLLAGRGLSSPFGGSTGPSAFLAPGYPGFVAAVFAVFQPYSMASAIAVMTVQAVFGAATVLCLMLLTQRAFGARAANVAGLVWAVSPPLLWLPAVFWETSFSAMMVCVLMALTLRCVDGARGWMWGALGACAAVGMLVNPSLVTVVGCCFGWAGWKVFAGLKETTGPSTAPDARRLRPASLRMTDISSGIVMAVVVCAVLYAPWPVRNARAMHAFIPARDNMGYEAWQGNRLGATGFFEKELHPNKNREEFREYSALGELGYMRSKSELAKAAVEDDPGRFAQLTLRRAVDFWIGWNPDGSWVMVAYSCATLTGGLAGLYLLMRRKSALGVFFALPLVMFPVPYYVTHPDFRFRLVVDPLLVALLGYAAGRGRLNIDKTDRWALKNDHS